MLNLPTYALDTVLVLPGHPYSKKNAARGSGTGQYYTTKAYQQWSHQAGTALARQLGSPLDYRPIDIPVNMECHFFLEKDFKVDLSGLYEGPQDVLVKAGVILDDNYKIVASHNDSTVAVDRDNPRTEVRFTKKDLQD